MALVDSLTAPEEEEEEERAEEEEVDEEEEEGGVQEDGYGSRKDTAPETLLKSSDEPAQAIEVTRSPRRVPHTLLLSA